MFYLPSIVSTVYSSVDILFDFFHSINLISVQLLLLVLLLTFYDLLSILQDRKMLNLSFHSLQVSLDLPNATEFEETVSEVRSTLKKLFCVLCGLSWLNSFINKDCLRGGKFPFFCFISFWDVVCMLSTKLQISREGLVISNLPHFIVPIDFEPQRSCIFEPHKQ